MASVEAAPGGVPEPLKCLVLEPEFLCDQNSITVPVVCDLNRAARISSHSVIPFLACFLVNASLNQRHDVVFNKPSHFVSLRATAGLPVRMFIMFAAKAVSMAVVVSR